MNEHDQQLLKLFEARQRQLRQQLDELDTNLRQLRTRLESETAAPAPTVAPRQAPPTPAPAPEPVLPAPITAAPSAQPLRREPALPPPLPPVIVAPVKAPEPAPVEQPVVTAQSTFQEEAEPAESTQPEAVAAEPQPERSFEMRLGTYWFVRVGVVMLLTSLVFAGNYVYKNFIAHVGPAGKVALLYMASGVLLGLGSWFSRRTEKESMKNYGQVLFAGGLAAVYFTTYAAHYFENLRVIESPVVDGILLLGWAAGVAWLADRRKSEVLALFAVGLAYYSSIITNIGLFTLFSNLVLTAAAVFFLVRNRWTTLSFASLVATYAGFAFWRFYSDTGWKWDWRENDLWNGALYLTGYWLTFTAATFFTREGQLEHQKRGLFTGANNIAYFLMVVLSMLHVHHGSFWKFSLGFGVVLLALALVARRFLQNETAAKNVYVTQGLVLTTVGIIAYFTGLRLALVLAAESTILFVLALRFNNRWLRYGSYLTGLMAAAWSTVDMKNATEEMILGSAVGLLLAFNAVWARQGEEDRGRLKPGALLFSAMGIWSWLATVHVNVPLLWRPPLLAMITVGLTGLYYVFRSRELTVVGQVCLLAAVFRWMLEVNEPSFTMPWWSPAILIGSLVLLSHWWQRQTAMPVSKNESGFVQGIYGLAFIGVLFLWLHPRFTPEHWLAFTSMLAIVITAYGIATRAWFLAGCGQFFLWVSAWEFVRQITAHEPTWLVALTPIVTLVGTVMAVTAWLDAASEKDQIGASVRGIGELYHCVALIMSLWWVNHYIPAREQFWVLSAVATALFGVAGWQRSVKPLIYGGVMYSMGWMWFMLLSHADRPFIYWPNLLSILMLPVLQRVARLLPDNYPLARPAHGAMMVTSSLALWLYISGWVDLLASGHFYFTASWAVLAFLIFGAGFVLRERTYRWTGLVILAFALARVVLLDVWRLETVYRILSFMALGVVLLVLGFIYNKYQEKIREWL